MAVNKSPIYFIVPDVDAFLSGGNIYNKNLIGHLKDNYLSVHQLSWQQFINQEATLSTQGYYFFDTLYLSDLAQNIKKLSKLHSKFLIVHHLQSLYPPTGWNSEAYFKEKEYPLLRYFDGFLTSSNFTVRYLNQNGLPQPKVAILPALTIERKKYHRKKHTSIKALIVANVIERKGILPFLNILSNRLENKNIENLEVTIAGSLDMEKSYVQACKNILDKQSKLKKIIQFTGSVSPRKIENLYLQSNLYLSTSLMETYGMALQEARAYSLPIIGLDRGNVGEHIVQEVSGFLVDSMEALIKQLLIFCNKPSSLEALRQISQNQPKAQHYTWAIAAIKLIDFLKKWSS